MTRTTMIASSLLLVIGLLISSAQRFDAVGQSRWLSRSAPPNASPAFGFAEATLDNTDAFSITHRQLFRPPGWLVGGDNSTTRPPA